MSPFRISFQLENVPAYTFPLNSTIVTAVFWVFPKPWGYLASGLSAILATTGVQTHRSSTPEGVPSVLKSENPFVGSAMDVYRNPLKTTLSQMPLHPGEAVMPGNVDAFPARVHPVFPPRSAVVQGMFIPTGVRTVTIAMGVTTGPCSGGDVLLNIFRSSVPTRRLSLKITSSRSPEPPVFSTRRTSSRSAPVP